MMNKKNFAAGIQKYYKLLNNLSRFLAVELFLTETMCRLYKMIAVQQ